MRREKKSLLGLLSAIFVMLLLVLVSLRAPLLAAHMDETIQYFSSDAATFFELYHDFYADLDLADNPVLFMIGSPILFMKLVDGNLFVIQLFNLVVMGFTLRVALKCLPSVQAQSRFLVGAFVFPYFVFGFLSLNKEIYAMCSAILFGCYLIRGRRLDVLLALALALCARYYMFVSLLAVIVMLPRAKPPRYKLILAILVIISVAAPISKTLVPQYSSEEVRDVSGLTGLLFSQAVDSFAYAVIYPIKYVALIPLRAYSFILSTGREADAMEALVSVTTLWVFISGLWLLSRKHCASPLVRQLVVAGLIAPIPMMWSDIMHWRYYSYVYFFFTFALAIHASETRARVPRLRQAVHA